MKRSGPEIIFQKLNGGDPGFVLNWLWQSFQAFQKLGGAPSAQPALWAQKSDLIFDAFLAVIDVSSFSQKGVLVMIDTAGSPNAYFTEDELSRTLGLSRKQFIKSRKEEYRIVDDRILVALTHINESNDYAKVIWRVQQGDPKSKHFFDAEYLAGALTALKMFYSLEIIDGRNLHSLSKTLDVFWHAHQDFTFDYMRFCDKVFGAGQFLHHLPLDKRSKVQEEVITRRYNYTRTMLENVYNIDRKFWGQGLPICCSYESHAADGFVFWKPALIAMEPACNLYNDSAVNAEIQKKTNFVIDGFAALARGEDKQPTGPIWRRSATAADNGRRPIWPGYPAGAGPDEHVLQVRKRRSPRYLRNALI